MQPENSQIIASGPGVESEGWNDFPESSIEEQKSKRKDITEGVRRAGAETMRRTKEEGEAFLGQQKHTIAETMHHCGDALRGAAEQLRSKEDRNLASIADAIADRLDNTSTYLDRQQFQDIRADLESFARRQPQVFYGSLFVAGLALSRFFKASQVPDDANDSAVDNLNET